MNVRCVLMALALVAGCDETGGSDPDDNAQGEACEVAIPASAEVVDTPTDFNSSPEDAWVCGGGGAATVNASGGVYYVESGGLLTANSGSFTVYADDGATVTINAGADVELYRTSGATVSSYASSGEEIVCDSLSFDLGNAPADGC